MKIYKIYSKLLFIVNAYLISLCSSIKINNKWIHEVNKEAKGHNIGTNLLHMMNVTKSMIRPQTWFFDVSLQKPVYKYIKEAEEEGLKYQILKQQDEIDRIQNNIKLDFNEKLNENIENKLIGREFNNNFSNEKKQIIYAAPQVQVASRLIEVK